MTVTFLKAIKREKKYNINTCQGLTCKDDHETTKKVHQPCQEIANHVDNSLSGGKEGYLHNDFTKMLVVSFRAFGSYGSTPLQPGTHY